MSGFLWVPDKGEPNCPSGVKGKEALILRVMQGQGCLLHIDPSESTLASQMPSSATTLSVDVTSSDLFLHQHLEFIMGDKPAFIYDAISHLFTYLFIVHF